MLGQVTWKIKKSDDLSSRLAIELDLFVALGTEMLDQNDEVFEWLNKVLFEILIELCTLKKGLEVGNGLGNKFD